MLYVLITLVLVILALLVCVFVLLQKYHKYRNQLFEEQGIFLYNKGKVSMIEAQYKSFKEGQNAFTTLRNISNVLKDYTEIKFINKEE